MPIFNPANVLLQIQSAIDTGDLSKAYVYSRWLQRQKCEEEHSVACELMEEAGWGPEHEEQYWLAQEEILSEWK